MGLSASQARFLQLTARRSNVEYEAQQISFQRLQLASNLSNASNEYNDAISNRQLVFSYNTGSGVNDVVLSYANYKNYMNQQMEGLSTTQQPYYLVSQTGKFVVSSEEERDAMMNKLNSELATSATSSEGTNKVAHQYTIDDFIIAEDLDDVDNFQSAIREGIYYFAQIDKTDVENPMIDMMGWDTLGGGAITDEVDKTDDAAAEAEFERIKTEVQSKDKKLEMRLEQLETERNAISTEMESIEKVIQDNIEQTFKTFG